MDGSGRMRTDADTRVHITQREEYSTTADGEGGRQSLFLYLAMLLHMNETGALILI